MDGSVHFAGYHHCSHQKVSLELLDIQQLDKETQVANSATMKHGKYVKSVVWSPSEPILATAAADGTVRLIKVLSTSWGDTDDVLLSSMSMDDEKNDNAMEDDDDEGDGTKQVVIEQIVTLHLSGPVEAMTFLNNGDVLCCFVRGTPYLSYFDLRENCKLMKHSINGGMYCTVPMQ